MSHYKGTFGRGAAVRVPEVSSLRSCGPAPQNGQTDVATENIQPNDSAWIGGEAGQAGIGLLLADLNLTPIYINNAGAHILNHPRGAPANVNGAFIQERIRSILQAQRFTTGLPATRFLSGGQRYTCRPFLIESRENGRRPQMVALLLERSPRDPIDWPGLNRRFHLSRRESETVQYLIRGLTTKEVAERMGVSPNTVKQFIRLIMTKMVVTTRSGIIGKLITASLFDPFG